VQKISRGQQAWPGQRQRRRKLPRQGHRRRASQCPGRCRCRYTPIQCCV